MSRVLIAIVEGPHDAAFIYKILKCKGFNEYKGKVKDIVEPIGGMLKNPKHYANIEIEDMSVFEIKKLIFPSDVLYRGDEWVLLFPLEGNSNRSLREKVILSIHDSVNVIGAHEDEFSDGNTFSIAYFWDADDAGIRDKMRAINSELGVIFDDDKFPVIESNASYHKYIKTNVGIFIFTQDGEEYGRLENILLPLMQEGNADIFAKAEEFLSIHEMTNLFRGKITLNEGGTSHPSDILKVNGIKFDYEKSLVGTIGQLQKSGSTNSVCIRQADYLTNEKIISDATCGRIVSFIEEILNH